MSDPDAPDTPPPLHLEPAQLEQLYLTVLEILRELDSRPTDTDDPSPPAADER